ncbi:tctex1 domain-containing protein 1-B-like [Gouania willdenowi]|uniref:Tctex1 domain-containing protein 1-B-like n=1 Tax=Gouania willdenowi TaxID=441366 RepID=A0A8C5HVF0_GOUWI|nr:tctex1 domain-containing protein 1-B-like [Gouania willdenowi]
MAEPSEDKSTSERSHGTKSKKTISKTDSISTGTDIQGHQDDNFVKTVTMANTYQLGPYKRFPVTAATQILKDVLTAHLQFATYEVEWSQKMTKTLAEVIKSHVKDLGIPRYKYVVLVTIGQIVGHGMQISSRCLWDATNDTFASYSFKNSSLFGIAAVYAVYYE